MEVTTGKYYRVYDGFDKCNQRKLYANLVTGDTRNKHYIRCISKYSDGKSYHVDLPLCVLPDLCKFLQESFQRVCSTHLR